MFNKMKKSKLQINNLKVLLPLIIFRMIKQIMSSQKKHWNQMNNLKLLQQNRKKRKIKKKEETR